METTISKWGNSLAVRIPRDVAKAAGWNEGDRLALDLSKDGSLALRPCTKTYKLAELVSRITIQNRHRETDWQKPLGKESW